jgi:hypothetical protein
MLVTKKLQKKVEFPTDREIANDQLDWKLNWIALEAYQMLNLHLIDQKWDTTNETEMNCTEGGYVVFSDVPIGRWFFNVDGTVNLTIEFQISTRVFDENRRNFATLVAVSDLLHKINND